LAAALFFTLGMAYLLGDVADYTSRRALFKSNFGFSLTVQRHMLDLKYKNAGRSRMGGFVRTGDLRDGA
jgi:hypothetical protein